MVCYGVKNLSSPPGIHLPPVIEDTIQDGVFKGGIAAATDHHFLFPPHSPSQTDSLTGSQFQCLSAADTLSSPQDVYTSVDWLVHLSSLCSSVDILACHLGFLC